MVERRSRIPGWLSPLGASALAAAWAVFRRPGLWWEALRQARPVLSGNYRGFRSVTAYGDPAQTPTVADVVAWLRWARSHRRLCRRHT